MPAKYAINLKDGTIVYRSKATDAMPVLFRWIPDEVAKGIMEKRIDPKDVTNIIMKKVFSSENFDHSEYEAELKKLNVVFKEEEVPEPEEVVDTTTDNIADSVSMEELAGAGAAPAPAQASEDTPTPPPPADTPAPRGAKGNGKPTQRRNASGKTKTSTEEPPAEQEQPADEPQGGDEGHEDLDDL